MTPEKIYADSNSEIWIGNSLDSEHVKRIVGERQVDSLIFDAPYSEKCHTGHANGKLTSDRAASFAAAHASDPTPESRYSARKSEYGESGRRDIDYGHFTPEDCSSFSDIWVPLTKGWVMSITDDILAPVWKKSFEDLDRYAFAPVPLVETGSRVRMSGDGPSSWTCYCMVARPRTREYASWGTICGAYVVPGERKINAIGGSDRIVGGKPLKAMIQIVEDYSKSGELVVDPFCGGATTGVAAIRTGRRFLGIEKDPGRAKLSAEKMHAENRHTTRYADLSGQKSLFDTVTA